MHPQETTLHLRLYGTIYGAWRSTDDKPMQFRLLERIQNFPTFQEGDILISLDIGAGHNL